MSRSLILDSAYLQTAIGSHFLTQWHALFHYFPIPIKSVIERFNPEVRLAIDTALVCYPLLKNGADLGQQMMRVSMNVSAYVRNLDIELGCVQNGNSQPS